MRELFLKDIKLVRKVLRKNIKRCELAIAMKSKFLSESFMNRGAASSHNYKNTTQVNCLKGQFSIIANL